MSNSSDYIIDRGRITTGLIKYQGAGGEVEIPSGVGKQVSKEIAELYVRAGYSSAERLMLDYGFAHISTEAARSLRSSVLYQPGFEPESVKPRIDYIMQALEADYPGKIITDVMSKSHKSIYKSLLGISVWLGYDSAADMLNAYGFTGITSESGRIAIDHNRVLDQLALRYEGKEKPTSITELISDNPDMKGNLKTLTNRASELFGMTFLQYLKSIGLIVSVEREEQTTLLAKNRIQIIEDIRKIYDAPGFAFGTFLDVENTLNQIVVKKNKKNQIYVIDCSSCKEVLHAVLSLYINVKKCEKTSECVLTVKTGVDQIAFFVLPFGKAAVVKRLFSVFDDERYDAIVQAFLQRDQTPDSAIAILKRMDALKVVVKSNNIIDSNHINRRIGGQQCLHTRRYILRLDGFPTADHIGSLLIITNCKP